MPQMPPFFIRSTIFNLCFYALTAISCILLLPTLFLPHSVFLAIARGFSYSTAFLEKYILGLTYEIRGLENLPTKGSYIVAAKHQSAYETFKLHILFNNPAIVLKKELLKIPLWGKYLAKSDVIAIDRSSPKAAIKSIKEGAQRVASQGRPIVIFPQGTRVAPDITTKDKPYKIGIVRMQEATGLPIVPLALNTGVFYPKGSWIKRSGHVVFEFMPPIMPSDDSSEILRIIEMKLEEKSSRLAEEGKKTIPSAKSNIGSIALLLLVIIYTANWFIAADIVKKSVISSLNDLKNNTNIIEHKIAEPKIHGFPFKLKLSMGEQFIKTRMGKLSVKSIKAQSLPFMNMPIDIKTGDITILANHWKTPLDFDGIDARIIAGDDALNIEYAYLAKSETRAQASGMIDFSSPPYPVIDLALKLINFEPMLEEMASSNIIDPKAAMLAYTVLQSIAVDGVLNSTITSQGNKVYLGPIKIFELPPVK